MFDKIKLLTDKLNNQNQRIWVLAVASLMINFAYGIGNAVIGFMTFSWWFITASIYYIILSTMRFYLILSHKKNSNESIENEIFVKRFSGAMVLCLSFVLIGTVLLAVKQDVGTKHHEIVMITIATYAFTKLVFAVINFCRKQAINRPIITALRNISAADAAVSIFSLQRSMLISFEGMKTEDIKLFNLLTGSAVCLVVFILGINLLRKERKNDQI